MIRINLLPQEYRRGQRVSSKALAVTFVSALASCSTLGWLGVVYFGDLASAESEHETVATELAGALQRSAYYDRLEANRKDYLDRVQTIQDIGKSRRLWSKTVDELIDVVNNDGDTDRHLAWFDGVTVKDDARNGTTMNLPGHVQGKEIGRIASVHEDIERAPFAKELATKSDPGGKQETNTEREPPESFSFALDMKFQPRVKEDPKSKSTGRKSAANQVKG